MKLEIFKSSFGYYNLRTVDGYPTQEMTDYLKANGYRWSRNNNCWYPATADAKEANLHDDFVVKFQERFFDPAPQEQKSFGQELIEREQRKTEWREAHGLTENKPENPDMVEMLVDDSTNFQLDNEQVKNIADGIKNEIVDDKIAKLEELIAELREEHKRDQEKIAKLESELSNTREESLSYETQLEQQEIDEESEFEREMALTEEEEQTIIEQSIEPVIEAEPEESKEHHAETLEVSPEMMNKINKVLEAKDKKDLPNVEKAFIKDEITKVNEIQVEPEEMELAKSVLPISQYITTLRLAQGEEGNFFKQKIKEIATAVENAPKIGRTDGQEEHPIALRYFHPTGTETLVCEIGSDGEAYGFQCLNGDYKMAEFGYIDLNEVRNIRMMEIDYHVPAGMTIERWLYKEHPDLFPEYANFAEPSEKPEQEEVRIETENGEMMSPEELRNYNAEQKMQHTQDSELDELAEGKEFAGELFNDFHFYYNNNNQEYLAIRYNNSEWEYAFLSGKDNFNIISREWGFSPDEPESLEEAAKLAIEIHYHLNDETDVDYDTTPAKYAELVERAKQLDFDNWIRPDSSVEHNLARSLELEEIYSGNDTIFFDDKDSKRIEKEYDKNGYDAAFELAGKIADGVIKGEPYVDDTEHTLDEIFKDNNGIVYDEKSTKQIAEEFKKNGYEAANKLAFELGGNIIQSAINGTPVQSNTTDVAISKIDAIAKLNNIVNESFLTLSEEDIKHGLNEEQIKDTYNKWYRPMIEEITGELNKGNQKIISKIADFNMDKQVHKSPYYSAEESFYNDVRNNLLPEVYKIVQDNIKLDFDNKKIPYVVLNWSENFNFPIEGKVYTLKEFNDLLLNADKEFHNRKEYAEKKYGSVDNYFKLSEEGKLPQEDMGIHFGYDKTEFKLFNIPNPNNPEDTFSYEPSRYDIGDGNGSVFDYIRSTCSHDEFIEAMNILENQLYFPEVTDIQIKDVENIVSAEAKVLSENLKEKFEAVDKANEAHKELHKKWLIEASEAERVDAQVENSLADIKKTYEVSMNAAFTKIADTFPFATNKPIVYSQFMQFAANEVKKMAINELYLPSRNAQKAMNSEDYQSYNSTDWEKLRKIWNQFPANVNMDQYSRNLLNTAIENRNERTLNAFNDITTKEEQKSESPNYHFYVKDMAEFEEFADFEPITNLSAEEAVNKFLELNNNGNSAGIGIVVPGTSDHGEDFEGTGFAEVFPREGQFILSDVFFDKYHSIKDNPDYITAVNVLISEFNSRGAKLVLPVNFEENKQEQTQNTPAEKNVSVESPFDRVTKRYSEKYKNFYDIYSQLKEKFLENETRYIGDARIRSSFEQAHDELVKLQIQEVNDIIKESANLEEAKENAVRYFNFNGNDGLTTNNLYFATQIGSYNQGKFSTSADKLNEYIENKFNETHNVEVQKNVESKNKEELNISQNVESNSQTIKPRLTEEQKLDVYETALKWNEYNNFSDSQIAKWGRKEMEKHSRNEARKWTNEFVKAYESQDEDRLSRMNNAWGVFPDYTPFYDERDLIPSLFIRYFTDGEHVSYEDIKLGIAAHCKMQTVEESNEIEEAVQLTSKKDIKAIREQCKEILKKPDSEITDEDKQILAQYEGAGGLNEEKRTNAGILNEFYTPNNLVEKVWQIVDAYAPNAKTVLEPSAGIGKFANNRPNNEFTMHELDETSARINRILHPEAKIIEGAYQKQFFDEGERFRRTDYEQPKYDVIIGNPPYGTYNDKYKGLGEGREFDRYEEYFISKGLEALKDENSVMAFVVPSGFLNTANDKQKELIASKGKLIDAYRLPVGTFPTTEVGTDIIILQSWEKDRKEIDLNNHLVGVKIHAQLTNKLLKKRQEESLKILSESVWFKQHPEKILGKVKNRTNRFGKEEEYVAVHEGLTVQNELDKIDSMLPAISSDRHVSVDKTIELMLRDTVLSDEMLNKLKNAYAVEQYNSQNVYNPDVYGKDLDVFERDFDNIVLKEGMTIDEAVNQIIKFETYGQPVVDINAARKNAEKYFELAGYSIESDFDFRQRKSNNIDFDFSKETYRQNESWLIKSNGRWENKKWIYDEETFSNPSEALEHYKNAPAPKAVSILSVDENGKGFRSSPYDPVEYFTNIINSQDVSNSKIIPEDSIREIYKNAYADAVEWRKNEAPDYAEKFIAAWQSKDFDGLESGLVYNYPEAPELRKLFCEVENVTLPEENRDVFLWLTKFADEKTVPACYKFKSWNEALHFDVRGGTGIQNGKKRTYEFFKSHLGKAERAKFLKDEYGIGGGGGIGYNQDHDSKGLKLDVIIKGEYQERLFSWEEVAEAISIEIMEGTYYKEEKENTQSVNKESSQDQHSLNPADTEQVTEQVVKAKSVRQKKDKWNIQKSKGEVMTAQEFSRYYGRDFDEREFPIWAATDWQGNIDLKKLTPEDLLYLDESGNYVMKSFNGAEPVYTHKVLFTSGDIYAKIEEQKKFLNEAEKNKAFIGEITFNMQKKAFEENITMLEKAKKPVLDLDRIHFGLKTTLSEEFTTIQWDSDGNPVEVNLQESFILWCQNISLAEQGWRKSIDFATANITHEELGEEITFSDIVDYIDGKPVKAEAVRGYRTYNMSEEEKKAEKAERRKIADLKRQNRSDVANKLFDRYIHEAFDKETRERLVAEYNRRFNSYIIPDYSKLPLFVDGMSAYKGNSKFRLYQQQIKGISFLCNKGNGLLAYDVGVGKTAAGIVATVNQIQTGRSQRPLIIVPNQVYAKWYTDIKQLFPNMKINDLYNFNQESVDKYIDKENPHKLNIPVNSISLCTYEALKNITFTDESCEHALYEDFSNLLSADMDGTERENAESSDKIKGTIGSASHVKDATYYFFEDCGFDNLTVDEAHNFKNLWVVPRPKKKGESNEYAGIPNGKPSARALKMYAMTQLVQRNNDDRNVFMLTATPFTNSPTEVYSMLSYIGRKRLHDAGLSSLRSFFDEFAQTKQELGVTSKGEIDTKQVMKNWKELPALQSILTEFIDKVDGEEAKIVRPYKRTHVKPLDMSELQKRMREIDEERMAEVKEGNSAAIIVAMNNMRLSCVAPALANPAMYEGLELPSLEQLVETSPKLKFVCDSIIDMYKDNSEKGQFMYVPLGKESHGIIKDYLVAHGIPKDAIEIVNGEINNTPEKKEKITAKFNNPKDKLKIIIGGRNTAEGIDLNGNSFVMYNCSLGWNPSETIQAEGRIWRQGNLQGKVHVVYPVMNDSIDSVLYQKHSEKISRIDELWSYKGDDLNVEQINPEDLKFDLIKDPNKKAKLIMQEQTKEARAELSQINLKIKSFDEIMDKRKQLEFNFNDAGDSVKYYEEQIEQYKERGLEIPAWIKESLKNKKRDLERSEYQKESLTKKLTSMNIESEEDEQNYLRSLNNQKHLCEEKIKNIEKNMPEILQKLTIEQMERKLVEYPVSKQREILEADILSDLRPMKEVEVEVRTKWHEEMLEEKLKAGEITQEEHDLYKKAGYEKYDKWLNGEIESLEEIAPAPQPEVQKTESQPVVENVKESTSDQQPLNPVENEPKKNYQVITYSDDIGSDEKLEYATLKEAKEAGKLYLQEEEGFGVFNLETKKIEYTTGNFPVEEIFSEEVLKLNETKNAVKAAVEAIPSEAKSLTDDPYSLFFGLGDEEDKLTPTVKEPVNGYVKNYQSKLFNIGNDDLYLSSEQLTKCEQKRDEIIFPVLNGKESGMYKAFNDFAMHGVFDIVGTKIDLESTPNGGAISATGWNQLHAAMNIYRDKHFETMRYVLVDRNNGEIRDQIALCSRMPNKAMVSDGNATLMNVITRAEQTDSLIVAVHNHPSGNITASPEDTKTTLSLEKSCTRTDGLCRFAGHIILDHDTFNLWTPENKSLKNLEHTAGWLPVTDFDRFGKEDELLNKDFVFGKEDSFCTQYELMKVASKINDKNNWNDDFIPVVFSNSSNEVSGIKLYHKDFFNQTPQAIRNNFQFAGIEAGAIGAFPVVTDAFRNKLSGADYFLFEEQMKNLVQMNAITDAALPDNTVTAKYDMKPGLWLFDEVNYKASKPEITSTWEHREAPELFKSLREQAREGTLKVIQDEELELLEKPKLKKAVGMGY